MTSARVFPGRRVFFYLAVSLSAYFLFASKAAAFDNPQRYYDWGPSETRVSPQVLGTSTEPIASPPAEPQSIHRFAKFSYPLFFTTGIRPESPLYFLKTIQEKVVFAVTRGDENRSRVRLAIAGRRLEELEGLVARNKTAELTRVSQAYGEMMAAVTGELEKFKAKTPAAQTTLKNFEEEVAKHTLVLNEVAVKVPDQAKPALALAVGASEKAEDRSADFSGRPPLPTEILDRLQALKSQGLLSSEEVTAIVALKSRTEARETLRKYAESGVFPPSDLTKFSEVAKEKFREEFQKAVEIKKFFELKKLEEEKPDEEIIKKVQDLARTYQSGELVPPDLRRYWVPLVRLEELQNTIRPDLIDEKLLAADQSSLNKFQEVVKRVQPRPEDILQVEKYIAANPNAALDPFYERVRRIGGKFGAACGTEAHWVAEAASPAGGYCAPNNNFNAANFRPPEIKDDRFCLQVLTPAKSPEGVCAVFPNSCLPDNWSKVSSCAPDASDTAKVSPIVKSCPSNSHWVAVPGVPEGGYCVPNITYVPYQPPTAEVGRAIAPSESICPEKYHRNYPSGPCVPDSYFGPNPSYPTYTPGGYPSPIFPPVGCPTGFFWSGTTCLSESRGCSYGTHYDPRTRSCRSDTEPERPACPIGEYPGPGGFCTDESKAGEAGKCSQAGRFWTGKECLEKAPSSGEGVNCPAGQTYDPNSRFCTSGGYGGIPNPNMGGCKTLGECYDWCQKNPAQCPGFNPNGTRPNDDSPMERCYRSGKFWNGTTCVENSACGGGSHWVSDPSRSGGGYCVADYGNTGGGNTGTGNTGACPPGQYRGSGGYCVSSYSGGTPSRESQEAACRAGGGSCVSWVNGACGCERPGGSGGPSGTMSRENQEAGCRSGGGTCSWNGDNCNCQGYRNPSSGTTPPSGYGNCSGGQYWNGSSCVSSNYSPPSGSDPQTMCQQTPNCSWTGNTCNCSGSSTQAAPQPTSPPPPAPTSPASEPTQPPSQPTSPPSQPSSGGDPATMCAATPGCSWTGSTCNCTPH